MNRVLLEKKIVPLLVKKKKFFSNTEGPFNFNKSLHCNFTNIRSPDIMNKFYMDDYYTF